MSRTQTTCPLSKDIDRPTPTTTTTCGWFDGPSRLVGDEDDMIQAIDMSNEVEANVDDGVKRMDELATEL